MDWLVSTMELSSVGIMEGLDGDQVVLLCLQVKLSFKFNSLLWRFLKYSFQNGVNVPKFPFHIKYF